MSKVLLSFLPSFAGLLQERDFGFRKVYGTPGSIRYRQYLMKSTMSSVLFHL